MQICYVVLRVMRLGDVTNNLVHLLVDLRRYAIDDHNVPALATVVAFCRDLEERSRVNPEIVFAFHCRGGKGRTGLMICAWLLWSRHCRLADEALDDWVPDKEKGNACFEAKSAASLANLARD